MSVLGGITAAGLPRTASLSIITNTDGSSNTLLMGHKGVPVQYYYVDGPDAIWADTKWNSDDSFGGFWNYYEHKRWPGWHDIDQEDPPGTGFSYYYQLTTPHPGAGPYVHADGSVRAYDYLAATDGPFENLWSYNDGLTLTLDK